MLCWLQDVVIFAHSSYFPFQLTWCSSSMSEVWRFWDFSAAFSVSSSRRSEVPVLVSAKFWYCLFQAAFLVPLIFVTLLKRLPQYLITGFSLWSRGGDGFVILNQKSFYIPFVPIILPRETCYNFVRVYFPFMGAFSWSWSLNRFSSWFFCSRWPRGSEYTALSFYAKTLSPLFTSSGRYFLSVPPVSYLFHRGVVFKRLPRKLSIFRFSARIWFRSSGDF